MGCTASTEPQCLYKVALFTLHPLTQGSPYTAAGRDPTGPHTVANAGKHNTQEKTNSYKIVPEEARCCMLVLLQEYGLCC